MPHVNTSFETYKSSLWFVGIVRPSLTAPPSPNQEVINPCSKKITGVAIAVISVSDAQWYHCLVNINILYGSLELYFDCWLMYLNFGVDRLLLDYSGMLSVWMGWVCTLGTNWFVHNCRELLWILKKSVDIVKKKVLLLTLSFNALHRISF